MAFQTRCPECDAKLKFDEAPDADEAIECPRCGHVYEAADAKPIKKKQKVLAGGGEEKPRKKKAAGGGGSKIPKKRVVKRKKSNPVILWVMLAGAAIIGPAFGYVAYKLFFSTGKMGQILAYIPADCNWMRGVDVERLGKIKSQMYQTQLDLALDGPLKEGREQIAKSLNADAATVLDYAMTAKIKNGGNSGTMHVFTTVLPYNSATLLAALGGKAENIDGQDVQKLGGKPGPFNNAYVLTPTDKMIVVVTEEGNPRKMVQSIVAAKNNPKEASIQAKLGTAGKKASRAHVWNVMRPEGDLNGILVRQIADPLKSALSALSSKVATTKMFAVWVYFGKDVKYGVAIECGSDTDASDLVKAMNDSEKVGKRDDSDLPRDLKNIAPFLRNAMETADFMSNLSYNSSGPMAYLESKLSMVKSLIYLSYFNKPTMWEAKEEGVVGGRPR